MNKNDWNLDLYLKFDKERIQPSIDLAARIDYLYFKEFNKEIGALHLV